MVGWAIYLWLLNDTHYVLLDPLTRPVNNPITSSLINPNIDLYCFFFSWNNYFCISKISLVSIGLKSTEKNFTLPFNPVFFILIVKSFEILPKHSA